MLRSLPAMRALFMGAIAIGGCGRYQFDELHDATVGDGDAKVCGVPAGHDEDADGIDDACDFCPNLPDTGVDTDGDGVGDLCDPTTNATEQLSLFDPFLLSRPMVWNYPTNTAVAGDALQISAIGRSVASPLVDPPIVEVISIEFEVTSVGGGNQRAISFGFRDVPGSHWYFCELTDIGGPSVAKLTYTPDSGQNYFAIDTTSVTAAFVPDRGRLEVAHSPTFATCRITWGGVQYEASGAIPNGLTATIGYLSVSNANVDARSIVRISTI